MTPDRIPAILGALCGAALGLGLFVALPMASNIRECGSVFLCSTLERNPHDH